MTTPSPSPAALLSEIATLKLRLEEAEGTLEAIHSGAVDALLIGGRVFTLEGAEQPYHELVDRMTEGAVFLNRDGVILYANRYLAELLDTPLPSLTGATLLAQVVAAEQARMRDWLAQAAPAAEPLEVNLITPAGDLRPVLLALATLDLAGQPGCGVIVTDLRARQAAEAKILRLNRLYAMASAVNAVIARQPERTGLFQEFCRIAVDLGGHRLAWIGMSDPASGVVAIVAAAGATGYLDGLAFSSRDVPGGAGRAVPPSARAAAPLSTISCRQTKPDPGMTGHASSACSRRSACPSPSRALSAAFSRSLARRSAVLVAKNRRYSSKWGPT